LDVIEDSYRLRLDQQRRVPRAFSPRPRGGLRFFAGCAVALSHRAIRLILTTSKDDASSGAASSDDASSNAGANTAGANSIAANSDVANAAGAH
jgi:hypothetical protein